MGFWVSTIFIFVVISYYLSGEENCIIFHFSLYPSLIAMEIDSLVRFGYVFKGCVCMLFATPSFCFEDRTTEAHNPKESWNRMGLVIDGQNVLCPNLYFGGTQFCHCQEFHHNQQQWAAAQIFVLATNST